MDELYNMIKDIKFFKIRNSKAKKYQNVGGSYLHFGTYIERFWGHGESPCLGSRHYPEIEEYLKQIAKDLFPDFKYKKIQINKNVKTPRHIDGRNQGESYIFTIGNFKGGALETDNGSIDIWKKPTKFDGKKIYHWTGEWTDGDRYCIIYY